MSEGERRERGERERVMVMAMVVVTVKGSVVSGKNQTGDVFEGESSHLLVTKRIVVCFDEQDPGYRKQIRYSGENFTAKT